MADKTKGSKGRKVSKARASAKAREGMRKAQEISDRFQQSVFVRAKKDNQSPTGAYAYGRKRTLGESTPQARIADTTYANYGKFPRPKPRPKMKGK